MVRVIMYVGDTVRSASSGCDARTQRTLRNHQRPQSTIRVNTDCHFKQYSLTLIVILPNNKPRVVLLIFTQGLYSKIMILKKNRTEHILGQ